jgi:hypothetical protein
LTEPESFGQPVPEKTILVMVGDVGGAAKASAGSATKKNDDRMVGVVSSLRSRCFCSYLT